LNSKSQYSQIIKSNQDAFVAGNPYPDFAYAKECFDYKYHEVSETTHWAPFLNATINYIRRTYKRPWNQQAQKLIAFTYGFVSHQVADISWHSLGIDQGFIRAMANVNFHAVFGDAHDVADIGGDMMSQLQGDDSQIDQFKWFVPSADLYEIYKEYYGKEVITKDIIEECSTLLFLAWLGEKIAGAKLFKTYAKKSPFLHENLHNYFLGGIHDMASWTNEIWQHTETMIEHGTEACYVPKSTLFIRCDKNYAVPQSRNDDLRNPGKPYVRIKHNLRSTDVVKKRTGLGMFLYPRKRTLASLEAHRQGRAVKEAIKEATREDYKDVQRLPITSSRPYSEAGRFVSIAETLPIGASLLYGAPNFNLEGMAQVGRVFVVNASSILSEKQNFENSLRDVDYDVLEGTERLGKFGWDVAVVDINKDGLDDIAISAPSQGGKDLHYYGAVYFYFGRKGQKYPKSADLVVEGNSTFENFGYTLLATDVNRDGYKDLVIGSPFAAITGPQRGRVDVVLAMSNVSEIKREILAIGYHDYQWFGYSLDVHQTKSQLLLFVGAPASRKCANKDCSYSPKDVQEKGKVYIFDVWYPHVKLVSTIEGPAKFSKFGSSLAVGYPFGVTSNPFLAVSAPSVDVKGHFINNVPHMFIQAGSVYLFNLTSLNANGNGVYNEQAHFSDEAVSIFSGDRDYGKFGMSVTFRDINDDAFHDLLVGAPFRTEDLTEEIIGSESGSLYIFNGGKSFPLGDATGNCGPIYVEPCPSIKASKSFQGSENQARFGASFDVFKQSLFVSSPRSSHASFHSGSIEILRLA